jgi:hypothetical protein
MHHFDLSAALFEVGLIDANRVNPDAIPDERPGPEPWTA